MRSILAAGILCCVLVAQQTIAQDEDGTSLQSPEVVVHDNNLYILAPEDKGKRIIMDAASILLRTRVDLNIDDPAYKSPFVLNDLPKLLSTMNNTLSTAVSNTTVGLRSEFYSMINIQQAVIDKKQEQIEAQAAQINVLLQAVAALKAQNERQQDEFDSLVEDLESRCISGMEYEKAPRTETSERICIGYTQCAPGTYETVPPTLTSDRVCSEHSDCNAGEYEIISGSATHDRVCDTWKECTADEYEVVPPSLTNDRVCKPLTKCSPPDTYALIRATARTDNICFQTTVCKATEFMSKEATATSDRACTPLSPSCTSFEYEAVSPVQVGPDQRDRKCLPITLCNFNTQYQSAEPTRTTDRRCVDLRVCTADEYEAQPPTKFTQRNCTALSPPCGADQYQALAPTKTSDRVCKDVRGPCAEGETETPPTPTSDRYCRPPLPDQCLGGYVTLDASVFPNRFPSNTDQSSVFCDSSGEVTTNKDKWVRFKGSVLNKIPDAAPAMQRCGTHAPGWVRDGHPKVKGDVFTAATVCYHWSGNTCNWSNSIQITNCDTFFLYKLFAPPVCSLRYCVE